MRYLALILVAGAVAAIAAPEPARAFDIQGQNATIPEGVQPFSSPSSQFFDTGYSKGSSLALPYIGKADSSAYISDYGNMIAIPAPGVDLPRPAWAYR